MNLQGPIEPKSRVSPQKLQEKKGERGLKVSMADFFTVYYIRERYLSPIRVQTGESEIWDPKYLEALKQKLLQKHCQTKCTLYINNNNNNNDNNNNNNKKKKE